MTQLNSEDIEPGKNGSPLFSLPNKFADLLWTSALVAFVLLFFFKTCFSGASISRLCVLAEWDSIFDAWRTGHAQAYDPSLVQIFLPDYVFLAKNLCHGILPLWNPHCGLGYPFIGDIQSSIFAPLRLFFDFSPDLRSYNWYLILELIVCNVSAYFLARKLQIARAAAAFAALTYTFCPYNLWYLELNLGSSAVLFPLIAFAFVQAAQKRCIGSALLAGVISGLLILSGHPECSFFGIALSSLLMVVMLLQQNDHSLPKRFISAAMLLFLAAIGTVAVSAPSLFPFAEYLFNSESYKFGSTYSTPVTWNSILLNFCTPGNNGASPYLGVVAAIAMTLSLIALRKNSPQRNSAITLFVVTIITFVLVSQLGPMQAIFSKAPFTAIITRYALPYLLMLQSLLAGLGLTEFASMFISSSGARDGLDEAPAGGNTSASPVNGAQAAKNKLPLVPVAAALVLLVAPVAIFLWSRSIGADSSFMKLADFDAMLPPTAFNAAAWKRDLICASIFSISSLALFIYACRTSIVARSKLAAIVLFSLALTIGLVSECSLAKMSLPLQSKFFYPSTEVLQKLQDIPERTLSTCEYVLRPATNSVYGINFLTLHNPVFPKRFLGFIKACGAKTDVFNQKFDSKLSPLLDLAAVKYILAMDPVQDAAGRNDRRFSLFFEAKNHIKIFENHSAAPRAFLVRHSILAKNDDDALKQIQSPSFDPRQYVVLEPDSQPQNTDSSGSPTASVTASSTMDGPRQLNDTFETVDKITFPDCNTIKIKCFSASDSWLVLSDIYYPGWQATVDGAPAKILHANYAFRAIKLTPGKHKIKYEFKPGSFYVGLAAFGLFAILCLVTLLTRFYQRRV